MLLLFPILAPLFTICAGWAPRVPRLPIPSRPFSTLLSAPRGCSLGTVSSPCTPSSCFQLGLAMLWGRQKSQCLFLAPFALVEGVSSGTPGSIRGWTRLKQSTSSESNLEGSGPKAQSQHTGQMERQTDGRLDGCHSYWQCGHTR